MERYALEIISRGVSQECFVSKISKRSHSKKCFAIKTNRKIGQYLEIES